MRELLAYAGHELLVFLQICSRKLGKFVFLILSNRKYIVDESNQCIQLIWNNFAKMHFANVSYQVDPS